jgi:hypothetical protein
MGFSPDWLALREPADHAARDMRLRAAAAQAAGATPVIVDLGCGTGSTIRAFGGDLPGHTVWRLVDNDAELLTHAAGAAQGRVTTHQIDLRDLASLPLDGASLVTASALLDLCSRAWVEGLAARLAARNLPFYAALNYDGVMHWSHSAEGDSAVTQAFNRHQRGDKGFGPALGPDAATTIAAIFKDCGYRVLEAESPWRLDHGQAALHRELVQGIALAASEVGETLASRWGDIRAAAATQTTCHIGHRDILALPKADA